jgi:hypothetical protein
MEYTTAGEQDSAPEVNPAIVLPMGGQFYPASKYKEAIDAESKLHWLDRPLGTCETKQWLPNAQGDMFNPRLLVPERRGGSNSRRIEELAYPKALLRSGPYDCRAENDAYAIKTSSDYMFNNATKQDRYKQMNKGSKPAPPSVPLKAAPEQLRPDLLLNAGPPKPVPVTSPVVVVPGSRVQNEQPVYVTGAGGGLYVNPSDLASAMAQNERMRAVTAGVVYDKGPTEPPASNLYLNDERSYERTAANQRADLQVNAVAPDTSRKPVTFAQSMMKILTTPFSEHSPWSPF